MTDERNLKPEYKQLELLIARGKREARIDAGRLDSILDALALPAEEQEEILRKIDDMGIRIDGRTQFPPGRQPCMEELEEAFRRNEPVLEYLKAIAQAKPLSPEEEKRQADRAARGDTLAGDALVEGNLLRVVSIARDFTGRGVCALDLIREGNDALVQAAKQFVPRENRRFSAFATRMVRSAMAALLENCTCHRIPEGPIRQLSAGQMETEEDRDLFCEKLLQRIRYVRGRPVTAEDWEILRLRFGLDRGAVRTLQEMEALGFRRETVRRVEIRNLRTFRPASRRIRIRNYYD